MMATLNVEGLPDPLYDRLRERARANHRSIAQEVAHILSEVLEEAESASLLEFQGLGKEIWADADAAEHVETERRSWD
ncbi:MAG TPA: Arc family DNA-binding protein [Myxococcota bacterium]|nr:Arc family DNA-binding protein [Myxococcota bacterium]